MEVSITLRLDFDKIEVTSDYANEFLRDLVKQVGDHTKASQVKGWISGDGIERGQAEWKK